MVDRHYAQRRPYSRTARVNALLIRVLAEEIERLSDTDERLSLLTVTMIESDPDLRRAKVMFSSLSEDAKEALEEHRRAMQAAIGAQVRTKRVPVLSFGLDPVIEAGARVEEALRRARNGASSADN